MARSEAMAERAVLGLAAGGQDEVKASEDAPGSRVPIPVSPTSLGSVEDVHCTLAVATTAVTPAVAWTRSVTSQPFGDGRPNVRGPLRRERADEDEASKVHGA